jgi:hypothetical protein
MTTQRSSSTGPTGSTQSILEPVKQPTGFGVPAPTPAGSPRNREHLAGFGLEPDPTPKMPPATRQERATR